MPPGWKPCRRTYRTAPPPRRCRRSAISTSLNSKAIVPPRGFGRDRPARRPLGTRVGASRTAPDRPTSPAPHRTALAPAAQPRPAPPGRALPPAPFTRGVNFGRRSGVTFRRRLTVQDFGEAREVAISEIRVSGVPRQVAEIRSGFLAALDAFVGDPRFRGGRGSPRLRGERRFPWRGRGRREKNPS